MNLNFTLSFNDLNSLEGLKKIDKIFLNYLGKESKILHDRLVEYRLTVKNNNLNSLEYSDFLTDVVPYFDDFIAELFFIESENFALKCQQKDFDIIYECRRKFVQRIFKNYDKHNHEEINFSKTSQELTRLIGRITQQGFAENVIKWLKDSEKFKLELKIAAEYATYLVLNNSSLPLFNIPRTASSDNLIRNHKIQMLEKDIYLGFDYRDNEINFENALSHAKYCIYCHHQQKDSCRYGIKQVKKEAEVVNGCPLDQKISEMNEATAHGFNIGGLGIILIDNPLVAATGHRICNDCMKACIFQKQDPVNIPLVESTILDNVLNLPYGVEIYILLTKWNPLNIQSPLPKESTNYNILVAGLGPAGFALSHYLLNEGHNVTAIDGLKIQPLKFDITKPIKDYSKIKVPLSERIPQGFGGVAEYGITNRWDKNNLTLIRLILERRNNSNFKMMGGIRLGSNISSTQAFNIGFDHIALCLGAGKPKYINSASYFFKGVKSAADFLMNLQQGGSYLGNSNNSVQLRMPVVVIGCGLTAIDSAVEAIHYYLVQVENFLHSYEQRRIDLDKLSHEDKIIAEEFIVHAKLLRQSKSSKEKLDILQQLGGVTICYRKDIKESPAYSRNHEEMEHAKAIGVKFALNLSPLEIKADKYNSVNQIQFFDQNKDIVTLPAKTVLVAIGTEDNEFEDINEFREEDNIPFSIPNQTNEFQSEAAQRIEIREHSRMTSQNSFGSVGMEKGISHFGDCNQKYSGSVVKALASAKNGYKQITEQLTKYIPNTNCNFQEFSKLLDEQLIGKVHDIREMENGILELVIKSPLAALNYRSGQIFRLQNYADSLRKTTKPLALSPYEVDTEQGLIYFVILKNGNSTSLCTSLKIGEEVVLMGPTGSKTNIPKAKTVILIGQGIRNLALMPIAKEIKKQGSKIIFFACYEKPEDILYIDKIEKLVDETHIFILSSNTEDSSISNISNLINILAKVNTPKNSYIICYATNPMLMEIKKYGQELFMDSNFICNILAPMQCMMKGICGQCIQKIDDDNGYIFSCACQEYDIKNFDPNIISNRLRQNSLLEKITKY